MWTFNSVFGKIFDILFLPLRSLGPWVGMVLISLLTGLFMLQIFRLTSNQEGIKAVKNRIKAHLLEMRLFKDNLKLSLKAQGNILKCNLRYIGYSGKPMLIMIIPLVLILIQLNLWFGYQTPDTGQSVLLKVKLKDNFNPMETAVSLSPDSDGVIVETLPLRMEEEKEIDWRIGIRRRGLHRLRLTSGESDIIKILDATASSFKKISPLKPAHLFLDEIFNPGEAPVPGESAIKSVELVYDSKMMNLLGWRMHWIIAYFLLSILFGFTLKGLFKVEI